MGTERRAENRAWTGADVPPEQAREWTPLQRELPGPWAEALYC